MFWRNPHLVCHYGTTGCSCVCCNHHTAIKETAYDRRSGARGFWQRDTLGVERGIAVVVAEVEAAHVEIICRGTRGECVYGTFKRLAGLGDVSREMAGLFKSAVGCRG
jgi:hypothetical protein